MRSTGCTSSGHGRREGAFPGLGGGDLRAQALQPVGARRSAVLHALSRGGPARTHQRACPAATRAFSPLHAAESCSSTRTGCAPVQCSARERPDEVLPARRLVVAGRKEHSARDAASCCCRCSASRAHRCTCRGTGAGDWGGARSQCNGAWYLQAGTPLRRCIPGTGQLPGDGALTGGPASLARRPSLPPLYRRETGPSAPAGLPDRSDEPCRVCPLEGLPAARPPPSGAPAAGAPLGEAVEAEAGLHGSPTQLLPSLPVVQLQLQDTVPPPAALQAEPRSQDPGLLIACRCEPAGAAQPVETPPVVKGAGWLPAEAGLLAALRAQSPKASAREPLSAELAAPESQILRFQC